MLAFFEKLIAKKNETAITKHDEWRGLVVTLADGHELDEEAVLGTLEHCGRSVDDLQAAVELVKQRREWASQIAVVPAAKAEIARIEAERKAAQDELNVAIRRHNDRITPLVELEIAAVATLQIADLARQHLAASCTDESLKSRIVAARDAIRKNNGPLARLIDLRGSRRAELGRLERADAKPEQIEQAEKHAAELNAEISRLESETRQFQAEMESVFAEKLAVMAL